MRRCGNRESTSTAARTGEWGPLHIKLYIGIDRVGGAAEFTSSYDKKNDAVLKVAARAKVEIVANTGWS